MEIKTGMKVKVNPCIATREYLSNCYFIESEISEKLKDISKGRKYSVINVDFTEETRDGKSHSCVRLESFGWIPKEAILDETNKGFNIGQIVKISKEIATEDYLSDCYFGNLKKRREEIIEGKAFKILNLREATPRGHRVPVPVAVLESFGWIPLEALNPCASKNTLPELKIGTILKTRGEQYYIVISTEKAFEIHHNGGKESLCNWNKSTGKHYYRKDFDIVAVYNPGNMYGFKNLSTATPIWTETIPAREMTVAEIEKELGHGVKVVGEDGEWEF